MIEDSNGKRFILRACHFERTMNQSPGFTMAKNIHGPATAKNISSPPMTKKKTSLIQFVPKFPRVEVSQNPSCPNFRKSKLLFKAS